MALCTAGGVTIGVQETGTLLLSDVRYRADQGENMLLNSQKHVGVPCGPVQLACRQGGPGHCHSSRQGVTATHSATPLWA